MRSGSRSAPRRARKCEIAKYFQPAIAYTSFEFTRVEYGIANDASLNRFHQAIFMRF
jgi:hypothetical protein